MRERLRDGVKAVAAACDLVAGPPDGVVILCYHQVGAPGRGAVNIDPAVFRSQMAWLAAQECVISLDDAVDLLTGASDPADHSSPASSCPRPVVLTFDDGTADFAEVAVPVMVEHGLPATLFLATRFVEAGRSFWDDGTVLTWSALAETLSTGLVTIGSHTHSHVLLDRETPEQVAAELDRSIDLIGSRLGETARHFAYPKAVAAAPAVEAEVRSRFVSASVSGGRVNVPGACDLWRLSRTPVQVADRDGWFRRKAGGGLRLEGALRERLDRRRYADASG